jgi:hypothetical protein
MNDWKNPTIMVCDCSSREHQIVIEHEPDCNMVFCHIHLAKRSFWRRIIPAIKYMFGYNCRYGHFEEFVFGVEHIDKLQNILEKISGTVYAPVPFIKGYHDVNEFYPEESKE